MTNLERNRKAQEMLLQTYGNTPMLTGTEDLKFSLLLDISASLASIADSLERSAPREHEDLN